MGVGVLWIPVRDVVLRFSASPGADTTSTTGTEELQNKSLPGRCNRGAKKLKSVTSPTGTREPGTKESKTKSSAGR